MNDRIKELAEQCWINDGGPDSYFSQQKFAELIVRECVDIADEYDGAGSTIVSRIEKHFGVEE